MWRRAMAAVAAMGWLVPVAAGGTTVDGLLFQHFPQPSEVQFDGNTGEIRYVFFPERLRLSDGQVIDRGAGSTSGSAPLLAGDTIDSGVQTLTFSADPSRSYLTRFGSAISGLPGGFQIELDFLTLRIEGVSSQATGLLLGSALLVSDELGVHATAPVGSVVPITGTVELLDGAVFGPGLTASDFAFTLDGEIDLSVPEPASALPLGLGLSAIALGARRRPLP